MKFRDFALEIKGVSEDATFEGYGSVFGNVDSYNERVMRGAFKKSLAEHAQKGTKVLMLWQHSPDDPIGVWEELKEDDKGLFGRGRLILEVRKAQEVFALIKAGAITGLSIGYRVVNATQDGDVLNLNELDVREISPVSFPANDLARVTAKSERLEVFAARLRSGEKPQIKEFEEILGDLGFPKALRVAVASAGYAKAVLGDPKGKKESDALRFLRAIVKK